MDFWRIFENYFVVSNLTTLAPIIFREYPSAFSSKEKCES